MSNDDLVVHTEEYKGMQIDIVLDIDSQDSPRDWDNAGVMACFHRNYVLGDKHKYNDADDFFETVARELDAARVESLERRRDDFERGDFVLGQKVVTQEDFDAGIRDIFGAGTVALPLFLYDHSGLAMSTSSAPFRAVDGAGWDWGQVGIIYMTRARAIQEFGKTRFTKKVRARALECLRAEVNVYDDYLRGNVYGFVVLGIDGECLDSCWGFIGEYDAPGGCLECARDAADSHAEDVNAELNTIADTTYTLA